MRRKKMIEFYVFFHQRQRKDENKNLREEISLRKNNRGGPARCTSSIFIEERNNATIAASDSRYSLTLAIA